MKQTVVTLLSLVLLLSGCGCRDPGDVTREINAVLDRYVTAYKAKDADAFADLYSYPAKLVDVEGREQVVTRDQMVAYSTFHFLIIDMYEMQFIGRSVNVSGNTALVTTTGIYDGAALGIRFEMTSQMEFTMTNSDGWKISVERVLSTTKAPRP